MEQTLMEQFYTGYLRELNHYLSSVNHGLEIMNEIYLRRINKKDEVFKLVSEIIDQLVLDRESYKNDIKRISPGYTPHREVVKWH